MNMELTDSPKKLGWWYCNQAKRNMLKTLFKITFVCVDILKKLVSLCLCLKCKPNIFYLAFSILAKKSPNCSRVELFNGPFIDNCPEVVLCGGCAAK